MSYKYGSKNFETNLTVANLHMRVYVCDIIFVKDHLLATYLCF